MTYEQPAALPLLLKRSAKRFSRSPLERLALISLLLMSLAGNVRAESEFDTLLKRARAGDATAQWKTGYALLNGIGVRKDVEQSLRWLERSARQRNVHGLRFMGSIFLFEFGYINYNKAIASFKTAAEYGDDISSRMTRAKGFLILDWNYLPDASKTVFVRSGQNIELLSYIAYSKAGRKGLFFRHINFDKNICKHDEARDEVVWVFGKQSVLMNRQCAVFDDLKKTYFELNPKSRKGMAYIVNYFKKSATDVMIETPDLGRIPVSASGFTARWNKLSADVL